MNGDELQKNAAAQREFFNKLAPSWRDGGGLDDGKIKSLLAQIPLKRGLRVLDVACGAGVLDACLLSMGLDVDGIDIAENMIEKARQNAANRGANYAVADFYTYSARPYDCILAFDCYPHFTDKKSFAGQAYALLKEGGTLWIFFDQSRESVNGKHGGRASPVSVPLKSAEEEAENFSEGFNLIRLVDDDGRYTLGFMKKPLKICKKTVK